MSTETFAGSGISSRTGQNIGRLVAYLFAMLAPALWAGNFVVARAMHHSLPPLTLNLFRWSIALVVLAPLFGRSLWDSRAELVRSLRPLFVLTMTGVVGFNSILYSAVHYTTAISASVLFAITPILICIINSTVSRTPPSLIQIMAGVISSIGAALVLGVHLATFSVWKNGDFLVLLASVVWAAYCVAIKRSAINAGGGAILLCCVILGIAIQFPLSIAEIAIVGLPSIDASSIAAVLYLGAGAAALGFLVWQRAINGLGPEKCGVFLNLIPVFGSILAIIFLHEQFSPHVLIGALVVGFGLILAQSARRSSTSLNSGRMIADQLMPSEGAVQKAP